MFDMPLAFAIGVVILVALYCYWRFFFFFRDPERSVPTGRNIVAPADGTVVYIKKVAGDTAPISIKKGREVRLEEIFKCGPLLGQPAYLLGIFMHPTDVHVNRAPVAGRVERIIYTPGKNSAMTLMWWRVLLGMRPYERHSEHITQNERNTILISGEIPLFVVQIADIYVSKIVCSVVDGDQLEKGQRIGMIKMGSQVDLLFPSNRISRILVDAGQKVKAGETIIASIK